MDGLIDRLNHDYTLSSLARRYTIVAWDTARTLIKGIDVIRVFFSNFFPALTRRAILVVRVLRRTSGPALPIELKRKHSVLGVVVSNVFRTFVDSLSDVWPHNVWPKVPHQVRYCMIPSVVVEAPETSVVFWWWNSHRKCRYYIISSGLHCVVKKKGPRIHYHNLPKVQLSLS